MSKQQNDVRQMIRSSRQCMSRATRAYTPLGRERWVRASVTCMLKAIELLINPLDGGEDLDIPVDSAKRLECAFAKVRAEMAEQDVQQIDCEHCDCYMADYYCCMCGAKREEEKEEEPNEQETG